MEIIPPDFRYLSEITGGNMNAQDTLAVIDQKIESRNLLKHPFYQAWTEGRLNIPILQDYASQYYHHVAAFPTYLSAVHAQTEDQETRKHLLQNLIDEEAGTPNHPELWLLFANALGVSDTEVMDSKPDAKTSELINRFREVCSNYGTACGIAALYAYESQIPAVAESKISGLKSFYNMDNFNATEYFRVHIEADKEHARAEKEMLLNNLNARNEESVLNGVDQVLDGLWGLLSGLCEKHDIQ